MSKTTDLDFSDIVKKTTFKENNSTNIYHVYKQVFSLLNRYLLHYVLDTKSSPENKMTNKSLSNKKQLFYENNKSIIMYVFIMLFQDKSVLN